MCLTANLASSAPLVARMTSENLPLPSTTARRLVPSGKRWIGSMSPLFCEPTTSDLLPALVSALGFLGGSTSSGTEPCS